MPSSNESDAVRVGGMNGGENGEGTYFADNPVVVVVSNLGFPENSPIKVCRLQVLYDGNIVGEFPGEVGSAASISFDISSALHALWSEYEFTEEIAAALRTETPRYLRLKKAYNIKVLTEYISEDGVLTTSESDVFPGGSCVLGGLTELERSEANGYDISMLEQSGLRNGDASTKPLTSPELVGSTSITSWVDVSEDGTTSIFYPASAQQEGDDPQPNRTNWMGHAPIVLRDTVPYTDFLFVNRRGAVETCSARMLEALEIPVEVKQYARIGAPAYKPSRAVMSVAAGGRRSWTMSSGYQTREWAEWWALEFLMARRHWMLYKGRYVPVIVTPAKKTTNIYDRTKRQMPSVEFTVTLALEG